jgi:hypothetical protein
MPVTFRRSPFSEWVTTVPFCLYDSEATFCVWLASYLLEVRNEEVFILLRHHARIDHTDPDPGNAAQAR